MMVNEINLNEEYRQLVPTMSEDDYQSFKENIRVRGQQDPIDLNKDKHEVLDGHHRLRACIELNIKPKTRVREFANPSEEKMFVIERPIHRRQLNMWQRIELALKTKPMLQQIVKTNESLGGKGVLINTPLGRVNKEIGRIAGAGESTVTKVEEILQKGTLEQIESKGWQS
jgi:ParB-like chromosome segregation protein Spo0J